MEDQSKEKRAEERETTKFYKEQIMRLARQRGLEEFRALMPEISVLTRKQIKSLRGCASIMLGGLQWKGEVMRMFDELIARPSYPPPKH